MKTKTTHTTFKVEKEKNAQVLTGKQAIARARRQVLKQLCNELQKEAEEQGRQEKPNILLREFYAKAGHKELKTFNEWKKEGYYIRKGEKAILLWGKPKPSRLSKEIAKMEGKPEEEAENDFYPLAYLYSNKQVETRI